MFKIIKYILGFFVVSFLLSLFFQNPFKKKGSEFEPLLPTNDEPQPTEGSTITDQQAGSLAEQLYDAMASFNSPVTAEMNNIHSAFDSLCSMADYNKVFNAFGRRSYSKAQQEAGNSASAKYNLTEWLRYDLKSTQYDDLILSNPQLQFLL